MYSSCGSESNTIALEVVVEHAFAMLKVVSTIHLPVFACALRGLCGFNPEGCLVLVHPSSIIMFCTPKACFFVSGNSAQIFQYSAGAKNAGNERKKKKKWAVNDALVNPLEFRLGLFFLK